MKKEAFNEYEKSVEDICDSEDISDETKQLSLINYSIINVLSILEKINKNLEKIADKDFMQIGDLKTTVNNTGRFLDPYHADINLDTIICNQNKDGHVDKNIILD